MEINVQSASGSVPLQVSDIVFGADYNEPLVHQVVTAYMAAGRAGTKAQKTRAQVRGANKKPWRQKGTGRARAGSSRGPLWRKGGVTFAAVPRDFSQKVNRKMYRAALRSIVSELLRQGRMKVVDAFEVDAPKTGKLAVALKDLGVNDVLIVTEMIGEHLHLAARNLPRVGHCDVASLDPLSLVGFEQVLITQGALKQLEARLA